MFGISNEAIIRKDQQQVCDQLQLSVLPSSRAVPRFSEEYKNLYNSQLFPAGQVIHFEIPHQVSYKLT